MNVESLTPKDISKVCCLRDAWHYLLHHINDDVNMAFLETLHELVARFDVEYQYLGVLRTDEVMISGTDYRPEIPDIERLHAELMELLLIENETERAIRCGLWLMRVQPFKDGNKRVGSFLINKILIEHGRGIFNVPVKLDGTFKQGLVDYYESGQPEELMEWVLENCIDGTHRIE